MHSGNITDMKGVSQEFSDCGLCNAESTKKLFRENCGLRARIESLRAYEKFKISERKVNFSKRLDL